MKKIVFGLILLITFSILLLSNALWKKEDKNNQYDSTYAAEFNIREDTWTRVFGGTGHDRFSAGATIPKTSDGGNVIAGGTESFGAGDSDIWALKLDSSGGIEWQYTYGGSEFDSTNSIQETGDGGYVIAGRTESYGAGASDIWVLKLDSLGDIEWQRTYGGSTGDYPTSIHQTIVNSGYVVAGVTESFGAGASDMWVLKLSSIGDIEWQKTYGGTLKDWSNSIQQTIDGGYVVASGTESYGGGGLDGWVLKLTSEGVIEWQTALGGSKDDSTYTIDETDDGAYILSGVTSTLGSYLTDSVGESDLWLVKISIDGDMYYCNIIRSTEASVSDTVVSPLDTSAIPADTNVVLQNTDILPQESDDMPVLQVLLCPGPYNLGRSSEAGGYTELGSGNATYEGGEEIETEAIANDGYEHTGWRGAYSGTDNPCWIIMWEDQLTLAATFKQLPTDDDPADDDSGGGSFIATASYGTPMAEEVKTLSAFRDQHLMTNLIGRTLVKFYYDHSPELADFIRDKEFLKKIIRTCLKPIIWILSKVVE